MGFFSHTFKGGLSVVIILLLMFASHTGFAQNSFGFSPKISFGFKIGDAWKANSKLESRFKLYQNPREGIGRYAGYESTGAEIIVARNKGPLKNLGGGYLIRRSDKGGSFLHRTILQYGLGQKLGGLQLAHRFRTDHSFENNQPTQHRLRYRISMEKPLSGLKVNPKEFYLKASNEYLGILEDGKGNLEIKLQTSLGYNQSNDNQIEMGLDYRAKNLIGNGMYNQLRLTLGWYHNF